MGELTNEELGMQIKGLSETQKKDLLVNNSNIIKLASKIYNDQGIISNELIINFIRIMNESNIDGVKKLEIIRDAILYSKHEKLYFDDLKKELDIAFSSIKINKRESWDAVDIWHQIKETLMFYKTNDGLTLYEQYDWSSFISSITLEDTKIQFITDGLARGIYREEIFRNLMGTVKGVDKRLELAKKTIDYQEYYKTEYLKPYMIYFAFKDNGPINTKKEVNEIIYKLKKTLQDDKLGLYVDPSSITAILHNIYNDRVLIETFNELKNDSDINKLIDEGIVLEFIKSLNSDQNKLFILKNLIKNKNIKLTSDRYYNFEIKDIIDLLKINIEDKKLLLDKELIDILYNVYNYNGTTAELYFRELPEQIKQKFKTKEEILIQNGNLEQLIYDYKTYGVIDNETYNKVLEIISKVRNDRDINATKVIIENSSYLRDIIEYISITLRGDKYNNELEKIQALFQKTRHTDLPPVEIFKIMNLELCQKFNVNIWRDLKNQEIFNKNSNTEHALVEMMVLFGLFENFDDIDNRKKKLIKLINDYSRIFSKEEIDSLNLTSEQIEKYFSDSLITKYTLREGTSIPPQFSGSLSKELTLQQHKRITKETGNIGSELNKFISPYVKEGNIFKLRNGIDITQYKDYLKEEMTIDKYYSLFNNLTPQEVINFLNPFQRNTEHGYELRSNLNENEKNEIITILRESKLNNIYTYKNICRIFNGIELTYNEEFYNLFIENQELILENENAQLQFSEALIKLDKIKEYFAIRGNNNPDYQEMILYFEKNPFDVAFGNNEFAKEAINAGVTEEGYKFYEKLLEKTRNRRYTTIPRLKTINKETGEEEPFVHKAVENGVTYYILVKILRTDDPLNLLVGESNFTNCCQRYKCLGSSCMEHAATSENGGILATYLLVNGKEHMLTQSWIWTNESKLCIDNIEATKLITDQKNNMKKIYQKITFDAIKEYCEKLIEVSKMEVDRYCEKLVRMAKLKNKPIPENLNEIKRRQTIKIITIGAGSDDLNIKSRLTDVETPENSYGPKGYNKYRDSDGSLGAEQYVLKKELVPIPKTNDNYKEHAIYRDDRIVKTYKGIEITDYILKRIAEIEEKAHKKEMLGYSDGNGNIKITSPTKLKKLFGCKSISELNIVLGEDWYYIYTIEKDKIIIQDVAKINIEIPEEKRNQLRELTDCFRKTLKESVVTDKDGNVIKRKPIYGEFLEYTSYLLYLAYKLDGKIEQLGEDIAYSFNDKERKTYVSEEQQKQIYANRRTIKETKNSNSDNIMHSVAFIPSPKKADSILNYETNKKEKSR